MIYSKIKILLIAFILIIASCSIFDKSKKDDFSEKKYDIDKISADIKKNIRSDPKYLEYNKKTSEAFKEAFKELNKVKAKSLHIDTLLSELNKDWQFLPRGGAKDAFYKSLERMRDKHINLYEKIEKKLLKYIGDTILTSSKYWSNIEDSLIKGELSKRANIEEKGINEEEKEEIINRVKNSVDSIRSEKIKQKQNIDFEVTLLYEDEQTIMETITVYKNNVLFNKLHILQNDEYFESGKATVEYDKEKRLRRVVEMYYDSLLVTLYDLHSISNHWRVTFSFDGYTDTQSFLKTERTKYIDRLNKKGLRVPTDSLERRRLFNQMLSEDRVSYVQKVAIETFKEKENKGLYPNRDKLQITWDYGTAKGHGEEYPNIRKRKIYDEIAIRKHGNDSTRRVTYFHCVFEFINE